VASVGRDLQRGAREVKPAHLSRRLEGVGVV
jgi:hypothetical protein